ncbi:MAG: hypothetical protein J6S14_12075 [Clostridia bacterium]|nr:hypothetical protein [Clostridia bacterium]
MSDMNKQALEMWGAMKPMIDKEIEAKTQGVVQRRKAKVTTAPSLITNKIGVTEPFGDEYFVPFNTNIMSAQVGDVVWVEWMYGATNAFASMFAGADEKDLTVAGDIHVIGNATVDGQSTFIGDVEFQGNVIGIETDYKMSASLSSAGWYRIMYYGDDELATVLEFRVFIPESQGAGTESGEIHRIQYPTTNGSYSIFSQEYSVGETLFVDKIRRTYGGSKGGVGAWAFDIHYTGGATNTVYVEVGITGNYDHDVVFLENLSSVNDAPSGEQVFPTKTFYQRTEGDISSFCSFNKTSGNSSVDYCIAYRRGCNVNIHLHLKATGSISAGSDIWVGTADVPLPLAGTATAAYYSGRALAGRIQSNGTLTCRYAAGSGSFSSGNELDFYFDYICD